MRLAVLFFVVISVAFGQEPTWRMITGDNPAFAQPEFDDSGWTKGPGPALYRTADGAWFAGVRWYRATFPVADAWKGQPLSLAVGPLDDVYEVYVEGALVGRFGSPAPDWVVWAPRHKTFDVPALELPLSSCTSRSVGSHGSPSRTSRIMRLRAAGGGRMPRNPDCGG